jgi:hypothetical protein
LPEYPATIPELVEELKKAAHQYGASAYNLFAHLPKLVRLLYPPNADGGPITPECAVEAEQFIRTAITAVSERNEEAAEALLIILGLKHDPSARRIRRTRRQEAARLLDVSPDTFRKNYEDEFIGMLAFELWRMQRERYADHA